MCGEACDCGSRDLEWSSWQHSELVPSIFLLGAFFPRMLFSAAPGQIQPFVNLISPLPTIPAMPIWCCSMPMDRKTYARTNTYYHLTKFLIKPKAWSGLLDTEKVEISDCISVLVRHCGDVASPIHHHSFYVCYIFISCF